MSYEIIKRGKQMIVRPLRKTKSRGVGDTIAKVTRAVGIKPCGGCKKRQKWLNEALPYNED